MSDVKHRRASSGTGPTDQRGAAAVEFVVVLTFVLLPVMAGILTFGFIFATQLTMNNAARDAARAAVVNSSAGRLTCADVATYARTAADPLGGDEHNVGVQVSLVDLSSGTHSPLCAFAAGEAVGVSTAHPCASNNGKALSVKLEYTVDSVLAPYVPFGTTDLTSEAKLRCEYTNS